MEKIKKVSSSWNIATTHWLTSAFVIPLILGSILGLSIAFIKINYDVNVALPAILIGYPIFYWFGAMYSAGYINKTYIITDSAAIIKKSLIILLIVGGGYRVLQIVQGGILTYEHMAFFLGIMAFYYSSKKYIKTTN